VANTTKMSNLFPVISYDDIKIYDIWNVYEVIERYVGDIKYYDEFVVPTHLAKRWDLIANEYYGTPNLWWFIYLFNSIIDPFELAYDEDRVIKIIKPVYLAEIFKIIKEQKQSHEE